MRGTIEQEIVSLDVENIDFDDKDLVKNLILKLLNIIELQAQEIQLLREENQQLKDEIAYLKGEKGKPKIPPNVPPRGKSPKTVKRKKWSKSSKNSKIKIDREVHIKVDKSSLPSDAVYVGEREVVTQNIVIKTDNVAYYLQRYYSRSLNKLFEAELPKDVKGTPFGAELKSTVAYLYYKCRTCLAGQTCSQHLMTIESLLLPCCQHGHNTFMNGSPFAIAQRTNDFPQNDMLA